MQINVLCAAAVLTAASGNEMPQLMTRRSGRKNLTVQCTLLSRYSLLRCWAHGGFLLQTCAPDTLLL